MSDGFTKAIPTPISAWFFQNKAEIGANFVGIYPIALSFTVIQTGIRAIPVGIRAIPIGIGVIPTGIGVIPTGIEIIQVGIMAIPV